jgi:hypothetical protein
MADTAKSDELDPRVGPTLLSLNIAMDQMNESQKKVMVSQQQLDKLRAENKKLLEEVEARLGAKAVLKAKPYHEALKVHNDAKALVQASALAVDGAVSVVRTSRLLVESLESTLLANPKNCETIAPELNCTHQRTARMRPR